MDIHNNEKKLESSKKRLKKEKNISAQNKQDIEDFIHHCEAEGLSDTRIDKYLISLIVIARTVDIVLRDATKKDVEKILIRIRTGDLERKYNYIKKKLSKWSQIDYKKAIRKFYTWLNKPELYEDISTDLSRKEKQQILPKLEDLPERKDIEKMMQKTLNERDKCLICFLFDSGARIGEALNVKLKDIQFREQYCIVRLFGKTGERYVPVKYSYPNIKEWYERHPYKKDKNSYFFINVKNGNKKPISYKYVSWMLKDTAKRANVKKLVNPHAFRHACASIKCHSMSYGDLCYYFGWSKSSDMPQVYLHMSPKAIEESMRRQWGINVKENSDEKITAGNVCPVCKKINKATNERCKYCNAPLSSSILREDIELDKVMNFISKQPDYRKLFLKFRKDLLKIKEEK